MKLIIGLGNPGEKYQKTRHNLGFTVLDEFAKKHLGPEVVWEIKDKFKAEVLELPGKILLIKPQTYMNNSGMAVGAIVSYYKLSLDNLIIIHDELDLPLGKIKIRQGGSAAGHHGVESVINTFKSDQFIGLPRKSRDFNLGDESLPLGQEAETPAFKLERGFIRIRLGIGNLRSQRGERGLENFAADKFVTEEFISSEKSKVKHMLKQAVEALDLLVEKGIETAQNQYN